MLDTSHSLDANTNPAPPPARHTRCGTKEDRLCRGVTMSHPARKVFEIALIAISIACLQPPSAAQDKAAPPAGSDQSAQYPDARAVSDKDIQLLREDIRSQRKQLIAANMKLTDAEAEKFWPVYEQYVSDLVKINGTKYALIKQYVQTGGNLTDPEAESAVKLWVDVDQSVAQLRMKYI